MTKPPQPIRCTSITRKRNTKRPGRRAISSPRRISPEKCECWSPRIFGAESMRRAASAWILDAKRKRWHGLTLSETALRIGFTCRISKRIPGLPNTSRGRSAFTQAEIWKTDSSEKQIWRAIFSEKRIWKADSPKKRRIWTATLHTLPIARYPIARWIPIPVNA